MSPAGVPVLLLLVGAVSGAGTEDAYNRAVKAFGEGRFEEAAEGFEAALGDGEFAAEHPEVYYHAGRARLLGGDPGKARELFGKADELVTDLSIRRRLPYWTAWAMFDLGDFAGALGLLKEHPVPPEYRKDALLLQARCLAGLGGFEAATFYALVREALKEGASGGEALSVLLEAAEGMEYPKSARFLEGVKDVPEEVLEGARREALRMAVEAGDWTEAARLAGDGGADDPLLRAVLLMKSGKPERAAEEFVKAAGEGRMSRGVLLGLGARLCLSKEAGRVLVEGLGKEDLRTVVLRGAALLSAEGRPGDAAALLEAAAERTGWGPEETWTAAAFWERAGKYVEAAKFYFEFAHRFASDGRAPEALYRAAALLKQADREQDALEVLRMLSKRFPRSKWAKTVEEREGTDRERTPPAQPSAPPSSSGPGASGSK